MLENEDKHRKLQAVPGYGEGGGEAVGRGKCEQTGNISFKRAAYGLFLEGVICFLHT